MTAFANINGENLSEVILHVPNAGPWWAEIVFETAPEVSGRATLALGELRLSGTLRAAESGTFAEQRRALMVAGAGGWATLVEAKHYHNDAGVRARPVADEVARIAGETIGTFSANQEQVGIDYVREAGFASRALEDIIAGAPWHVDYDGNTNVGARSTSNPSDEDYQVLNFDPKERVATLAVDDLRTIKVGSVISEGLDREETITELRIEVRADSVRVIAYTGGTLSNRGRVAQALRGIIKRTTDNKLFGKYRYRFVRTSGDRVELQAVRRLAGLPDILPISMQPGVAGAHSKLTPGTIVLVEFIEGDRTLPIVTAFAGKDTTGHETQELDFSVAVALRLGSANANEGAILGTSHKQWADNHTHGPGSFTTPVGSGGGGGAVSGTSGAPTSSSPDVSTKVFVE